MLSDVTVGLPGHTLTLTGADLLVVSVVVLAISILAMALNRGRRVELRHSAATDILIVQLERIGDTLDKIVAQNSVLSAAVAQRLAHDARAEAFAGERSAVSAAAMAAVDAQSQPPAAVEAKAEGKTELLPDESVLSDPVRSVVYSMLRP